ncbi:MAG: hypothetical protein ACFE8A_09635 [Candidatus Hodarchaeota archaeon]
MRKQIKIKLILIVFGIVLSLSAISYNNISDDQGNNNKILEIQDETNLRLADNEIIINSPENKTYTESMSGYYPATYSFDEQEGTTGTDIDFIDLDINNMASIEAEINGHKNVLELNSPSTLWIATHVIDGNPTSGTIEFYVRLAQTNVTSWVIIEETLVVNSISLIFKDTGDLVYNNGIEHLIQTYSANTWYHFKIEFDCADDWHLWIDNVSKDGASGYGYIGNPTNMNQLEIWCYPGVFYYDAFGYSWDNNYEIGDNLNEGLLLSYENNTNLDWTGYSLDGQANRTIWGNTTIPMPDDGQHTILISGNNTLGEIYKSELRHFTIGPLPPSPPSPSGNNGGGGDNSKDDSVLVIIVIVIITIGILFIISAIIIKRRSKQLPASSSETLMFEDKTTPNLEKILKEKGLLKGSYSEIEVSSSDVLKAPLEKLKYSITVICPICKIKKQIRLPETTFKEETYLATVSIPKRTICEHHFQVFIDNNFDVRGYQTVDVEIDSEKIHIEVVEEKLAEIKGKLDLIINDKSKGKKSKKK